MNRKLIRLSKSSISNKEKDNVLKVLDKEYLGMGKEVEKFEKELSNYFERDAICVVNGTSALQQAIQSIGIKKGDEILVQSLTFVASFQAISASGAKPISCDIKPNSLTIDIEDAKKRLTERTKAIMPVHFAGTPGDLNEIYKFAEEYNLRVIEDAAHAFGSKYKSRNIGSIGDICCFSFDGIKNITCGEGGCIVTSDNVVLEKIKDSRLLGIKKESENKYVGKRNWFYDVSEQGYRHHMSDIFASIGLSQLKRLDQFKKKRYDLVCYYVKLLRQESVKLIANIDHEETMAHIFPIILEEGVDRIKLKEKLFKRGIQTGFHYFPNHKLTFYRDNKAKELKITEKIYHRLITLPLHYDLSLNDIEYIVNCLKIDINLLKGK